MAKWDFSKIDRDYCVDEPRLKDLERPKRRDYVVQQEEEEVDWGRWEVDNVNHPSHYGQGKIECIDYIKDFLNHDEYVGYLRGNIAKYLHRWRYKNGLEDLNKAQVYLGWLIEAIENAQTPPNS